MFGFRLYNKNMAPLVNFTLTSVTLTQINTKSCTINFMRSYKSLQKTKRIFHEYAECSQPCVHRCEFVSLSISGNVCVHCSKTNANYWASASVKYTAVVTVSARWTSERANNLTVGGVFHSHPKNHRVTLSCSADVNQRVACKTQRLYAQLATVH